MCCTTLLKREKKVQVLSLSKLPVLSTQLSSSRVNFRIRGHDYFPLRFCIDVYSYDEDDMVLDPNLAEHLAHFGIDMLKMQKVRVIPV